MKAAIHLLAGGKTAVRTEIDLAPGELTHLPCQWPTAAWSYHMKIQLPEMDQWESIRWQERGMLCKKISIRPADAPGGPISFFESPGCPPSIDTACNGT